MAQGRELKGRIKSIEGTRKITRSMEMVATSKLKRAQDRVVAARPYARALEAVIADLYSPELAERFPLEAMGETGENVAERYGVSREDQDAFALRSHQRAVAAAEEGRFAEEIVPVELNGDGAFERDEGPRPDTSLEKLAKLKPAFREGGTVTAGNSSTLNDGAACLVIGSERGAEQVGAEPLARVVAFRSRVERRAEKSGRQRSASSAGATR